MRIFWYMNLFTTIDVVYTRMKRDTRIEIPVYKLIHSRKYTCLKPYVLQIIRVWNHTHYKSYALQSYAYEMTAFHWTISDTPLSYLARARDEPAETPLALAMSY